jgi:glycosyltransferase involved in cell wall biosynthesis
VIDLAVVGQDPRYGGGALMQMEAFLAAARRLGREPELLYVPHPTLHPERSSGLLERVEPLRLTVGSRRLLERVRTAHDVWVVSTVASHGVAAAFSHRPYRCWVGTSAAAENAGRRAGLPRSRRVALAVNAPAVGAFERLVLRRAEAIYATSPSSRVDVAAAAGAHPEKVGVLPLTVDVDAFTPAEDDEWLARATGGAPILAFVGRADDPRKNLPLALAAFEHIRAWRPAARLRVIGPGEPPRGDGVEALGFVPSVADALRDASLLLLTARQEGFGIAAAEALAAGVPIVATPSGGPEDMLRRSGGGIVMRGWDAAEIAAAARALLSEPDRLLAARTAGREHVRREHSPEALATALAGVLSTRR